MRRSDAAFPICPESFTSRQWTIRKKAEPDHAVDAQKDVRK